MEQDLTTIRSKHHQSGVWIQSWTRLPSALYSRCKSHPESQLRLRLTFICVCLYRKLAEALRSPSWSGIGHMARPTNSNLRAHASCRADSWRLWASRHSCCLSTPVGGFRPTTHSRPIDPGIVRHESQYSALPNMVEGHRDMGEQFARRRLDFLFNVNMAGSLWRRNEDKGTSPHDRSRKGEKKYITEEQVRHGRYQWPLSVHLLRKYEYQHRQHH
jgi:hypothetical protein